MAKILRYNETLKCLLLFMCALVFNLSIATMLKPLLLQKLIKLPITFGINTVGFNSQPLYEVVFFAKKIVHYSYADVIAIMDNSILKPLLGFTKFKNY